MVPDSLLLNITGSVGVTPIQGRTNRISQALMKAGISEKMALAMSESMNAATDTIKALFQLQLLMFNMKDIMGKMTIAVRQPQGGFNFEPVRIIDNLHLVFPTIHKTQNAQAKDPESFFSKADFQKITSTPALHDYLKITLNHNLERFLGISVKQGIVAFDKKSAEVFDQNDPKKSDFAKVLSRAIQSAVLFQIYGQNTNQIACAIIQEVRKTWPHIGMTPGTIDMILGSDDMQAILKQIGYADNTLTLALEVSKSPLPIMVPPCPHSLDLIDPFKSVLLPTPLEMQKFL